MYLASARTTPVEAAGGTGVTGKVPGTVVALGAVSLLTDVSAEMVTAFMPVYVLYVLQLGYVQFGLLDGLYSGATVLLRLVGGHLGDRLGKYRAVALAGYGISALSKLLFPFAGASTAAIGAVVATDRAGKGLRTAPRDALISLATPAPVLGRAFGLHRAMDTFGAMLGPLVTFLIMIQLGADPSLVFGVSFCFALVGVIVLVTFVPGPPRTAVAAPRPEIRWRDGLHLLRGKRFRGASVAATVLGFATISDAFVFVVLQKTAGVPTSLLPLLPLGTALVFLLAALPLGRVADRFGRWRMFAVGHVALLGVYALLVLGGRGIAVVCLVLLLHGLFYAATDGVLMAHGAELVPESIRASGLAILQTGQAVARLLSSVLFGVLLTFLDMRWAVLVAAVALLAALGTALVLTGRGRTGADAEVAA
ncbi:MFS transporter [Lentzea sp. NPDC042327]|uniref:MFS transporter n=1 Tax=Lentzea sp. NPDC042327 TaxID=3154801 RepID=UPI0033E794C3